MVLGSAKVLWLGPTVRAKLKIHVMFYLRDNPIDGN